MRRGVNADKRIKEAHNHCPGEKLNESEEVTVNFPRLTLIYEVGYLQPYIHQAGIYK